MLQAIKDVLFGEPVPSLEWVQQGVPEWTPDYAQLSQRPFHRVFIPDECMHGRPKHDLLEGSERLIRCVQTKDHFTVWRKRLGKASQIIPLATMFPGYQQLSLRGELWKVPTKQVVELDNYKLNGVQFERVRVQVRYPYTDLFFRGGPTHPNNFTTHSGVGDVWAWMYRGSQDYWDYKLVHASKIKHYKNKELISVDRMIHGVVFDTVDFHYPRNKLLEKYYFYSSFGQSGDS